MRSSPLLACTLAALAPTLGACRLLPDTEQPATPQRPTLSSDTNTTPFGSVELEAGVARDDRVSLDTPLTLKAGTGFRTEVSLGWSPWRRADVGAGAERGPGDVVVGLRHRLWDVPADETAYAVQALVKLPTAEDPELGTGAVDAQFAGIATRTLGGFGTTGYYALGMLGDGSGESAVSHSLAVATGTSVGGAFGAFGEVAAVLVPEFDGENVFTTLGMTWSPDPSLVVDTAIVLGLSDEAADWQLLLGLTKNLGRVQRIRF